MNKNFSIIAMITIILLIFQVLFLEGISGTWKGIINLGLFLTLGIFYIKGFGGGKDDN